MTSPALTPDSGAAAAEVGNADSGRVWTNPRKGFLFFFGFAAIGAGMAQLVPAVLTLSLKAAELDKANATSILSLVVAVSALFAIVAYPVFGRISDELRGRLGRRRPFLILAAILYVIGSLLSLTAPNIALLLIGGIFTTVGYSASAVALTSIIPDQFAPDRRGPSSAVFGFSLPVGAVVGIGIATAVTGNLALQFLIPAAVAVVGTLLFAAVFKDPQVADAPRPKAGIVTFFSTFWVNPVKHPPFAWAWFSRLLLFFGVAAVQAYQAFYLIFELHYTPVTVAGALFISTLILTVAVLVFAPISGKLSDKVGRRKPFVIVASIIFGIGLIVASVATSYGSFLVAIGIVGIGQGVYFAVDLALVTRILPDPSNPGQGMAIMGLASTLPSSLVPAVAPVLLAIGAVAAERAHGVPDHNFAALFIAGAIAAIVGAALIIPIKGVK
jgi:MFS family permease